MRRATLLGGVSGGYHSQKLWEGVRRALERLSRRSDIKTTGDYALTSTRERGFQPVSCRMRPHGAVILIVTKCYRDIGTCYNKRQNMTGGNITKVIDQNRQAEAPPERCMGMPRARPFCARQRTGPYSAGRVGLIAWDFHSFHR